MIELTIKGMTCGHCVKAVTEALSEVPGVDRVVEVSLERGSAQVEGNAETGKLIEAIEEEGYEAAVA